MGGICNRDLFDPTKTIAESLFMDVTYPFEILPHIGEYIEFFRAVTDEYNVYENNVYIHKTATVAPTAFIGRNTIIGANTEVRHCAFIRGNAVVGENVVIGNSTELKNVIIFDNAQIPHYNYVGDSIIGYKSHMGAGAKTSNVKSDKSLIIVRNGDEVIETGLKKFGAILADNVEVGCNSVLNPGTIIGKNTNIYPLSSVRGVVPENCIYKSADNIITKRT